MTNLIEPETERLILRQWQQSDRAPFAELNADPEVMRYFPATLSQEESNALADRAQAKIEQLGWGFWAVELKEAGDFIGFIGLNIPTADLPFNPCVEVGWRLAQAFWGRGYATEAARACLQVGFQQLELTEIVSFTPVGNRKSRAVMERLGMQVDPLLFEHPSVPEGSVLRKHCLYRLSSKQWSNL